MKKTAIIAALFAMLAFFPGGAFAHMNEGPASVQKGEKYEMMTPGEHMEEGYTMMAPGQGWKEGDDCWRGSGGMYGHFSGHHYGHYGWFAGFALVKVLVAGLFFWLLFRIARALEVIAAAKKE